MAVKKPQLPKGLLEHSEDQLAKKIIEWTQVEAKGLQSFIHDLLQTVNIPVVTSEPAEVCDQPPIMKLMDDGIGNRRLYIYYEGGWSYVDLTGGGGAPSTDGFGIIAVDGEDDVVAGAPHDTVTLIEGDDIVITTDAVNDEVTIGLGDAPYTHTHTNDHTHANKALLDTYSQTEANLADAVTKKHTHANQGQLDLVTDGDHDVIATGNPHSVTAVEVGALPLAGGTLSGDLALTQADSPYITLTDTTNNAILTLLVGDIEAYIGTYSLHNLNIKAHNATVMTFTGNAGEVSGISIKDEDNMASDSAVHLCTQQSIKKYVDDQIGGPGYLPLTGGTMTGKLDMDVDDDSSGVVEIDDTDTGPSNYVVKINRANNVGSPTTATAGLLIKDHSVNYPLAVQDHAANELFNVFGDGTVKTPKQPAFSAVISQTQTNIAVGSATTICFNTEIFDVNGDFNTGTYTFTAPVTGKYLLSVFLRWQDIDSAASYYQVMLHTSNRTYGQLFAMNRMSADVAYWETCLTVVADMDASDTAYVQVNQSGGTQQTDIYANTQTGFMGYLLG